MAHRLAVGHHHQRPLAQAYLGELLEPLLGPEGLADQPEGGLLLGGGLGPLEVPGEHGDLARDRAEETLVRQLGRIDGVAAPHRLRPARHLGQRLGQAHAHHHQRDQGEGQSQHHEADGVEAPEVPLRGLEVARVQEHHQRARRLVVAHDGIGVDVAQDPVHLAEAGLHRARRERPRGLRRRVLQLLGDLRSGRDQRGHPVVHRHAQIRLAELLDQPLHVGLADPWAHGGLERFLQALAHQRRAPIQLRGEPLAVLHELEVREGAHHDQARQPEAGDEPELELHVRLSAPTPAAIALRSARTSATSFRR